MHAHTLRELLCTKNKQTNLSKRLNWGLLNVNSLCEWNSVLTTMHLSAHGAVRYRDIIGLEKNEDLHYTL